MTHTLHQQQPSVFVQNQSSPCLAPPTDSEGAPVRSTRTETIHWVYIPPAGSLQMSAASRVSGKRENHVLSFVFYFGTIRPH